LDGLGMEKIGIFFGHLEYIKAIWYFVATLLRITVAI
jgi:hypothetical protein